MRRVPRVVVRLVEPQQRVRFPVVHLRELGHSQPVIFYRPEKLRRLAFEGVDVVFRDTLFFEKVYLDEGTPL